MDVGQYFLPWSCDLLSKPGCVTHAKSVITIMFIYNMKNIWLLSSTYYDIDMILCNFVWGWNFCHWIGLFTLAKSKRKGGLRIKTTRNSNTSILGKCVLDLLKNPQMLWAQMLVANTWETCTFFLLMLPRALRSFGVQ